jgi:hypothetical protein
MCRRSCVFKGEGSASLPNSNKSFTFKSYGVLVTCVLVEIGQRFASVHLLRSLTHRLGRLEFYFCKIVEGDL